MTFSKTHVLKNTKLCQTLSFVIVTYKRYKTENEILNTNYKTIRLKEKDFFFKCVLN